MDSSAIPVYLAGPYPVVYSASVNELGQDVDLDVALLIKGMPNILASTSFPHDDSWDRIRSALESGDARLGVAGIPHEEQSPAGVPERYPSAYVGLECANGERLVLSHIRGLDPTQDAQQYARDVIDSIMQGFTPEELGVTIDEED